MLLDLRSRSFDLVNTLQETKHEKMKGELESSTLKDQVRQTRKQKQKKMHPAPTYVITIIPQLVLTPVNEEVKQQYTIL